MNRLREWLSAHAKWIRGLRAVLVGMVIIGSGAVILRTVHGHYPVGQWLFWRYASYWLGSLLFGAGCLSVGFRLQGWLQPRPLPMAENLVTSLALGVFTFFLGMFLGGLAGLYGPIFALAWPILLLASGFWPLQRYLRRGFRRLRPIWPPRLTYLQLLALGWGFLCLFAVYFAMLTPDNVAYDARWYHLPLAEHYSAQGGISRFPEGWYPGTGPHLASLLYTWCFLLPGTGLFDRILLSAHLEFLLFLATLASIGPLVQRLLRGRRFPLAWVVTFLFPGILLYDSSLSLGADHIAAFFAIPIFLSLLRFWADPRPRRTIPLAIFISSAALIKYTAFLLVVLPIGAAVARSIRFPLVSLAKSGTAHLGKKTVLALLTLLSLAGVGILATTPHWLKNLLWYGDPAYPAFHSHLNLEPWTADSAAYYRAAISGGFFRLEGDHPVFDTLGVLFTFAFKPHNWPTFHGKVPVFGFLFTISTVLLLFFRRTGRAWGLVLTTWCGIALWYWLQAQDRYLQAALPWMVSLTATVLVLVWRTHLFNRVLLALLVGVQVVWGGDIYFFRTHAMLRDAPAKATIDLIATGHKKEYKKRLQPYLPWSDVGAALPEKAKVLVHESHVHLGLQAMSVNDWPGIQGGLNYGRLGSLPAVHRRLVDWGVTHIVWTDQTSLGNDSLAGDLLFFHYTTFFASEPQVFGGLRLARLPDDPPSAMEKSRVLYLGCPNTYAPGLHELGSMVIVESAVKTGSYPDPLAPVDPNDKQALLSRAKEATYIVHDGTCQKGVDHSVFSGFRKVARRSKRVDLWVRR